jgi:hypothetical protein
MGRFTEHSFESSQGIREAASEEEVQNIGENGRRISAVGQK